MYMERGRANATEAAWQRLAGMQPGQQQTGVGIVNSYGFIERSAMQLSNSGPFDLLLRQLGQQHAIELQEAVRALRDENRRLAAEVSGLRAAAGQGVAAASAASHPFAIQNQLAGTDGTDGRPRDVAPIPADAFFSPLPVPVPPPANHVEPPGGLNDAPSLEALVAQTISPPQADCRERAAWEGDRLELDRPDEDRDKTKTRLEDLMDLDTGKARIGPDQVQLALKKKKVHLPDAQVKAILKEFKGIAKRQIDEPNGDSGTREKSDSMTLDTFVSVLRMPNLVSNIEDHSLTLDLCRVQKAFFAKNVSEVIEEVTSRNIVRSGVGTYNEAEDDDEKTKAYRRRKQFILEMVNYAGYITIMLSILKLGVELDNWSDWQFWSYLEGIFASVFLVELIVKNLVEGPGTYFCGVDRYWNWLDAFITAVSVFEACLAVFDFGRAERAIPAARLTVMIRGLRLCRAARLVKMLRAPFLRDFASMLTGILIGAPWLFWSALLLALWVYILGMGFRRAVGPDPDDELLVPKCGLGDSINAEFVHVSGYKLIDECPIHVLLGEEFFGTIEDSMFTVFRCLIGDCSTRSGQSLVVHLGNGYGWKFYAAYYIGMTAAIFGLFNIITAMFVEATLSGLKISDIQKRYAKMYESRYVKRKLHAFVTRVNQILAVRRDPVMQAVYKVEDWEEHQECTTLKYDEYMEVMQDFQATRLLEDLDVETSGRDRMFAMTDLDGNGIISMSNLLETIVKMRGELRKADIVANWFAVRNLQGKFETFELLLQGVSKHVLEHEKMLRTHLKSSTMTPKQENHLIRAPMPR